MVRTHDLGDRPQDLVALQMAHPVVDRLEVVDVDDQHRHLLAEAPRSQHLALEHLEHAAAVPQARERVRDRLLGDPIVQPSQRARDPVGEDHAEAEEPEQQREGRAADRQEAPLLAGPEEQQGLLVVGVELQQVRAELALGAVDVDGLAGLEVHGGRRDRRRQDAVASGEDELALGQPLHLGRVASRRLGRDPQVGVAGPIAQQAALRERDRVIGAGGRQHLSIDPHDLDGRDVRLCRRASSEPPQRGAVGSSARGDRRRKLGARRQLVGDLRSTRELTVVEGERRLETGREAGVGLSPPRVLADEDEHPDQGKGRHEGDQDEEECESSSEAHT